MDSQFIQMSILAIILQIIYELKLGNIKRIKGNKNNNNNNQNLFAYSKNSHGTKNTGILYHHLKG